MGWCNNCRSEYEEHVKICAECGDVLVDELEPKKKKKAKTPNYKVAYNKTSFLIQAKNNIEADCIISLLKSYNISAYKEYDATGSYLNLASGFNFQGINISVPEDLLEDAKKIVDEVIVQESDYEVSEDMIELKELYENKKNNRIRIFVLWFVIIPLILLAIVSMEGLL